MKIKIFSILLIIAILSVCFVYIPHSQAIFDVNLTVRNGGVYVNDAKTNIEKTATFSGAPYIPLNLAAPYFGMVYEKNSNESVVSFSYRGNKLELDFNKKTTTLNGKPYTLLYGISKKSIVSKTHIFIGNQDIQNIFGIIMNYDESKFTTKLNTGFGVVSVDYSQEGGYQTESNMASAKTKLLAYANSLAASSKSSMKIADKTGVDNLVDSVFNSINSPITMSEFDNGMQIAGMSYKNANQTNLTYLKNIKFLAALANITVSPEYVGVYNVTSQSTDLYVVGVFLAYEGLDISDDDLVTAAVATIEDTTQRTLSETTYKNIATKVKTVANTLRIDNRMLVLVINKGAIGAVDIL